MVVGDAETLVGFRLGGIPEGYDANAKEAVEKLLLNEGERVSVVIITEKKLGSLPEKLRRKAEHSVQPVFIEILDKASLKENDGGEEDGSLARKVKTTLGIELPETIGDDKK